MVNLLKKEILTLYFRIEFKFDVYRLECFSDTEKIFLFVNKEIRKQIFFTIESDIKYFSSKNHMKFFLRKIKI